MSIQNQSFPLTLGIRFALTHIATAHHRLTRFRAC